MLQRLRNRKGGFTLIELLIVVAIIGIIAAILIPNLLDALQKAKQKTTMSDERTTGTAFFSWITDMVSAGAAGRGTGNTTVNLATAVSYGEAETILVSPGTPQSYLQELVENDGWGNPYVWGINGGAGADANDLQAPQTIVSIASGGRDGGDTAPTTSYERGSFIATDYDQDIVWADGFFVRRPGGIGGS